MAMDKEQFRNSDTGLKNEEGYLLYMVIQNLLTKNEDVRMVNYSPFCLKL
jgi:hypothetical protein